MSALIDDTFTRMTVRADELRPGDIVVSVRNGDRVFAAFDVDVRPTGRVDIFTATTDQAKGVAPVVNLPGSQELQIARRDGGPRVTRVAL